jgi:hypothetical protein
MQPACVHLNIVCAFALASALHITSAQAATPNKPDSDADVIQEIVGCVTRGQEAVLLREGVQCINYRDGAGEHKKATEDTPQKATQDTPLKIDARQICTAPEGGSKDWRRLSGSAIKRVVNLTKSSADPHGLRVIGAVFCQQLDLSGLDLPYALVIDRSVFLDGFEARNVHVRGDLSFSDSLALGEVVITRSHVEGSIYGNGAFIKKLQILDSKVDASLIFRESKIFEPAIFDTVSLSGELSVRGALLSYFLLQFSKVGGVLDLTDSQARCAYLISKSEIGDLVAVNSGFGTSTTDQAPGQDKAKQLFDWRLQPNSIDPVNEVNSNQRSTLASNNRECNYAAITPDRTFLVSDTRVRASLCFRSFYWLMPKGGGSPFKSFVTFNDVNVNGTSVINLTPADAESTAFNERGLAGCAEAPKDTMQYCKFEAIGLKTHSLVFNFDAGSRFGNRSVGGLAFEQAYTAADVKCAYDPKYSTIAPVGDREQSPTFSNLRIPRVAEVMSWLDNNCLQTTQPLSAFIDAARKAGDVAEATDLQIARETKELQLRIQHLFGRTRRSSCGEQGPPSQPTGIAAIDGPASVYNFINDAAAVFGGAIVWLAAKIDGLSSAFNFISDVAAVFVGGIVWLAADHGYRPGKVFWILAATLLGAAAYFRYWLKVVAFAPANKNTIRRIGLLFLFDQLLPAYRINEDNYNVQSFYKLVPKSTQTDANVDITYMNLPRRKVALIKADEKDVRRVEQCLSVVKGIGILLAVFLVAAINALVNH